MRLFAVFVAFALLVGPAAAYDDPMEAQRCIWRCLANSRGADDPAYHRCVGRMCSDKPQSKRRDKPNRRSEAPAPGRWGYGEHPRLGLSAYVEVGGEAFGFACPGPRPNGEPHGYAAVTRLTPGLSPGEKGSNTIIWREPFAVGGQLVLSEAAGYFEVEDNYCLSSVPRVRGHGAMLLLREKFVSLNYENGRNHMTVEGAAGPLVLATAEDVAKLDRPVEIPLAGAKAAVAALAKACRPLRRQIAEGCEVD